MMMEVVVKGMQKDDILHATQCYHEQKRIWHSLWKDINSQLQPLLATLCKNTESSTKKTEHTARNIKTTDYI